MIYTGENKAVLCKGDFRPAQLYKGETKITGYTETEFEGAGGITLENCYNDKIYDVQIRSKNLQKKSIPIMQMMRAELHLQILTYGQF